MEKQDVYRSQNFLLSIWRENENMDWRFSLRTAHNGQTLHFSDRDSFFNFVEEKTMSNDLGEIFSGKNVKTIE